MDPSLEEDIKLMLDLLRQGEYSSLADRLEGRLITLQARKDLLRDIAYDYLLEMAQIVGQTCNCEDRDWVYNYQSTRTWLTSIGEDPDGAVCRFLASDAKAFPDWREESLPDVLKRLHIPPFKMERYLRGDNDGV